MLRHNMNDRGFQNQQAILKAITTSWADLAFADVERVFEEWMEGLAWVVANNGEYYPYERHQLRKRFIVRTLLPPLSQKKWSPTHNSVTLAPEKKYKRCISTLTGQIVGLCPTIQISDWIQLGRTRKRTGSTTSTAFAMAIPDSTM
jgi:hypothetical protein